MQTWLKDLAGAWIFYSILPSFPCIKPSFKRIARFAPGIGLMIGSLQSCVWILFSYCGWPTPSVVAIVISFGIWVTGGLHIDGLLDTADGLAASKERRLKAMNDSRIGAGAIQTILIVILLQVSALIKLKSMAIYALPCAAFWGRCAPLWAIGRFQYLRKKGTANFHKKNIQGWKDAIPAFCLISIGLVIIFSINIESNFRSFLLISFFIGAVPTFLIPEFLGRHLGGHSGDSYGASVVAVETIVLICFALLS